MSIGSLLEFFCHHIIIYVVGVVVIRFLLRFCIILIIDIFHPVHHCTSCHAPDKPVYYYFFWHKVRSNNNNNTLLHTTNLFSNGFPRFTWPEDNFSVRPTYVSILVLWGPGFAGIIPSPSTYMGIF